MIDEEGDVDDSRDIKEEQFKEQFQKLAMEYYEFHKHQIHLAAFNYDTGLKINLNFLGYKDDRN